jgi:hypothetical protein
VVASYSKVHLQATVIQPAVPSEEPPWFPTFPLPCPTLVISRLTSSSTRGQPGERRGVIIVEELESSKCVKANFLDYYLEQQRSFYPSLPPVILPVCMPSSQGLLSQVTYNLIWEMKTHKIMKRPWYKSISAIPSKAPGFNRRKSDLCVLLAGMPIVF